MSKAATDQLQFQIKSDIFNTNTVGIDVSKQKNTVVILHPSRKVVAPPHPFLGLHHLLADFQSL